MKHEIKLETETETINIVNPFRGNLIAGSPGSGKTLLLSDIIKKQIQNGFAILVYDYKFGELTKSTYNNYIKYKNTYKVKPEFCMINFDDIEYSNRSNPLASNLINDFFDAIELSEIILIGLIKTYMDEEAMELINSPSKNLLAICIWGLKLKSDEFNKELCSLPHLIELLGSSFGNIFNFLMSFKDESIKNVLKPFINDLRELNYDELEMLIAPIRMSIGRITSKNIYYVMTTGENYGKSISLDVNDSLSPKILCIGNNPKKQTIYSIIDSLYIAKSISIMNMKNKLNSSLILDELNTLHFPNGLLTNLIATARANRISVWISIQSFNQFFNTYSEKYAKVIIEIVGNVFIGKLTGDIPKYLLSLFNNKITEKNLKELKQGQFSGKIIDVHSKNKVFNSSKMKMDNNTKNNLNYPKIFDFKKSGFDKENILNDNFSNIKKDIKNLIEQYRHYS